MAEAECAAALEACAGDDDKRDALTKSIAAQEAALPGYDALEAALKDAQEKSDLHDEQSAALHAAEQAAQQRAPKLDAMRTELAALGTAGETLQELRRQQAKTSAAPMRCARCKGARRSGRTNRRSRGAGAYLAAEEKADALRAEAEALRRRFNREQAGLMAAELKPGEPCPVCGSTAHPSPACLSTDAPTQAEVDEAEAAAQAQRDRATEASQSAGAAHGKLEADRDAAAKADARSCPAHPLRRRTRQRSGAFGAGAKMTRAQADHRRAETARRNRAQALADALPGSGAAARRPNRQAQQLHQELARAAPRRRRGAGCRAAARSAPICNRAEAEAALNADRAALQTLLDALQQAEDALRTRRRAHRRPQARSQQLSELAETRRAGS